MKTTYLKVPLGIGIILYAVSYILIIMHWPGGVMMRMIAYLLISLPYLWIKWQQPSEKTIHRILGTLVLLWALGNFTYMFYYSQRISWLSLISYISIISWLILLIYKNFILLEKNQKPLMKWLNLSFLSGAIILGIGVIFTIAHWPYGKMMLFSGLSIAGLAFILSLFLEESVNE